MDERARFDLSSAQIFEVLDSADEALAVRPVYGEETVVVSVLEAHIPKPRPQRRATA